MRHDYKEDQDHVKTERLDRNHPEYKDAIFAKLLTVEHTERDEEIEFIIIVEEDLLTLKINGRPVFSIPTDYVCILHDIVFDAHAEYHLDQINNDHGTLAMLRARVQAFGIEETLKWIKEQPYIDVVDLGHIGGPPPNPPEGNN